MMSGNNHTYSSSSSYSDILPLNTSCMHIHYKFKEYNWVLTKNTMDTLVYVKSNHYNDCDEFKIELNNNKIFISIPVIGNNISYKTHFNSYFLAHEYVSLHLENYEKNTSDINVVESVMNDNSDSFVSF